ncbi:MAG: MCE family protein [Bdellovibrionaceae bacterium]|nr:MCE family protein [Pseudobdellovibrionaceae bacterium]
MEKIKSKEFKVGISLVIFLSILALFSIKIAGGGYSTSSGHAHWFLISDATGIIGNSYVKISGVPVGHVESIGLSSGKARLNLLIQGETKIPVDSYVEIRAKGILGAKYVGLVLGKDRKNFLAPGSEIKRVKVKGSISDFLNKVGEVSHSIQKLSSSFERAIIGDDESNPLISQIIQNVNLLTKVLLKVTSDNQGKIDSTVNNLHYISMQLRKVFSSEKDGGSWGRLKDGLLKFSNSLESINSIVEKVDRGEGTIGKLINDEGTINKVNSALEKVSSLLGGVGELKTEVDFHSEYLTAAQEFKSFVGIKLQPGSNRHYELAVVNTPAGTTTRTITRIEEGGSSSVQTEYKTVESLKFNALLAKTYSDFTLRGGLIESSGGFAVDYHPIESLELSVQAFNFKELNLKTTFKYIPLKSLYVYGGQESAFKKAGPESNYFVGMGIFINSNDLSLLRFLR